jgi:hypothetical protein
MIITQHRIDGVALLNLNADALYELGVKVSL